MNDEREHERRNVRPAPPVPQPVIQGAQQAEIEPPTQEGFAGTIGAQVVLCLLYTSPSPRDGLLSRMPSSA